jgi:hypothetical protein
MNPKPCTNSKITVQGAAIFVYAIAFDELICRHRQTQTDTERERERERSWRDGPLATDSTGSSGPPLQIVKEIWPSDLLSQVNLMDDGLFLFVFIVS